MPPKSGEDFEVRVKLLVLKPQTSLYEAHKVLDSRQSGRRTACIVHNTVGRGVISDTLAFGTTARPVSGFTVKSYFRPLRLCKNCLELRIVELCGVELKLKNLHCQFR